MKSITPRSSEPDPKQKKYKQPLEVKPEHVDFLAQVGAAIEIQRLKHNINITELCKEAGISRFSYYQIIRGKVYWNSQTVLTILSHLNTDERKFFSSLKKSANPT